MMTYDENLDMLRRLGKADALDLRERAPGLTGTELIAEEQKVPPFDPEKDYSSWPVGAPVADEGQVWPLLQPHNAAYYTGRPSTLRALWGLAHTTDPARAKPFVDPYGTSGLYQMDECCTDAGHVWRNNYIDNAYAPSVLPERWIDLGEVSLWQ